MVRARTFLVGGVAGAVVTYLFDPDRGRGRRTRLRDQYLAMGRTRWEQLQRRGRWTRGRITGIAHELMHPGPANYFPDDVTLAHKVESEVLGGWIPSGRINVNAEDGVVILRGELDTEEQIAKIERVTKTVAGVREVRNLLHVAGRPAPNKVESQRVMDDG